MVWLYHQSMMLGSLSRMYPYQDQSSTQLNGPKSWHSPHQRGKQWASIAKDCERPSCKKMCLVGIPCFMWVYRIVYDQADTVTTASHKACEGYTFDLEMAVAGVLFVSRPKTSALKWFLRTWDISKLFNTSFTIWNFPVIPREVVGSPRNHRRQYECWEPPGTNIDPETEEEFKEHPWRSVLHDVWFINDDIMIHDTSLFCWSCSFEMPFRIFEGLLIILVERLLRHITSKPSENETGVRQDFYGKIDRYFSKEQVFEWDPRKNTLEELCSFLAVHPCPKSGKVRTGPTCRAACEVLRS